MKNAWFGVLMIASSRLASSQEQSGQEEDTKDVIYLGLYFYYDNDFKNRASTFRDEDGGFNTYLTVLTSAAEARFKDVDEPRIVLTLANSSLLEDESIIKKSEEGRKTLVNGELTMHELERTMTWNDSLPHGVDVVFLITGSETITEESRMTKEWKGVAQPRAICMWDGNTTGKAVGIVHDDGSTFSGAQRLALQVALLLGASKDATRWYRRFLPQCSTSQGYLTSSIAGGFRPRLSECSKNDLRDFFLRNKNRSHICWNDQVKAVVPDAEILPAVFYTKQGQNACEVPRTSLSRLLMLYECGSDVIQDSLNDCKIMCCDYLRGTYKPKRAITAPDGTICSEGSDDKEKICVYGECI
uniref:Reprolysin n=1 Tax=Rhipicephalus zambeziensis TaxID=60191 RepID=A0A224YPV2_9ACAR